MFNDVYSCTLMVTNVHSCSLVFTGVHSCIFIFTAVHCCSLIFTDVHYCSLMFIDKHSCSLMCGLEVKYVLETNLTRVSYYCISYSFHFNTHLTQLYISNKMECFNYKGESGIRGRTHIKAFM